MVDSVEHRVEMHRIARKRQAEGRSRWDERVPIAAYIHDLYSEDKVVNAWHVMRNVAELITERLGRFLDPSSPDWNWEFAERIEDMRERDLASMREESDAVESLDVYLEEIYDFFDHYAIWAGAAEEKIVKMISTSDEEPGVSP